MTESIKFGPEWLRNSVANHAASDPPPLINQLPNLRPQLADYRYGREEMLSLCSNSPRAPDCLAKYRKLFVATAQLPLALTPPTDDEGRVWLQPRAAPSALGLVRGGGSGGGGGGGGGGRGGSVDRGRGRARGLYHSGLSYQRAGQYEDEGRGAGRGDRPWLDRNGVGDPPTDWSNPTATVSPRKEYGGGGGGIIAGRATNMENWRKSGRADDEGGLPGDWRNPTAPPGGAREKWSRSTSWREEEVGVAYPPNTNGTNARGRRAGTAWGEEEPHLPEWATENPSDYGGTFDAAGAFHDSDEEQAPPAGYNGHERRVDKRPEVAPEVPAEVAPEMKEAEPKMEAREQRHLQEEYERHLVRQQQFLVAAAAVQPPAQEFQSAEEVADYMVANLIMDEDPALADQQYQKRHRQMAPQVQPMQVAPQKHQLDSWYYRDPQGEQQGPFAATEMAEWYKAGYFLESLFVWRSCDTRYSTLGELVKLCGGGVPFLTAAHIPPQQVAPQQQQQQQQQQPAPAVHQPEAAAAMQMFQKHVIMQQLSAEVDGWTMMTPDQQQFLLTYHLQQLRLAPPTNDFYLKGPAPQPKLSVTPVAAKLAPPKTIGPAEVRPEIRPEVRNFYGNPAPENPIKSLLMQLSMQKTGQMVEPQPQWYRQPPSMWEGGGAPETHEHQALEEEMLKNSEKREKREVAAAPPRKDSGEREKEERKRQKELKRLQEEEVRRKQSQMQAEEKRRQMEALEEKKRSEEGEREKVAAAAAKYVEMQREATLLAAARQQEKMRQRQAMEMEQRSTTAARVAPWSQGFQSQVASTGPSLADIQKAERDALRRANQQRDEQQMRDLAALEQNQRDSNAAKWQAHRPQHILSLAEIQAEEKMRQTVIAEGQAAQAAVIRKEKKEMEPQAPSGGATSMWSQNAQLVWNQQPKNWSGGGTSQGGFWEEPTAKTAKVAPPAANSRQQLLKSQTLTNMSAAARPSARQHKQQRPEGATNKKAPPTHKKDDISAEFSVWCTKAISAMGGQVDVPTFVGFLQDIESPFEVKDYIKMYLGETKECAEFGKQFLERRSKYKNQLRAANAHIDDMCQPAPAITPSNNSSSSAAGGPGGDFQEIKGRVQKVKKTKPLKLDSRILGFSVTAAPDRLNVGDRDYGDAS